MDYAFVLVGLVGLFFGGEALVRGSVGIAQRLGISPFLIGLTVVGFGTSTPELLVSLDAALRGVPDIALGNVIGSNIANILLVLGLTALIWPIRVGASATVLRDLCVMLATAAVLVPIFASGQIARLPAAALVLALFGYLFWTYRQSAGATPDEHCVKTGPTSGFLVSVFWSIGGLAVLMLGARFLVDGAVSIAQDFGITEAFIGLTIVAVGTSLPELATSIIAAFRRQSDIAIGNVIGSNIFNILGILGLTAVITPIPVATRFLSFDLPVAIAASLVMVGLLLSRQSISRKAGLFLLFSYAVYLWKA